MPRPRRDQPVLITSAPKNRLDELDERRRRYLWTMGVRTVAFVLSVSLLHGGLRVVAAILSIVLPWVAVVAANAGPRRVREQPSLVQHRQLGPGTGPGGDPDPGGAPEPPDLDHPGAALVSRRAEWPRE